MFAEKKNKIFDLMKADFGYKNVMQAPKIEKIIVSVGTGSVNDKNKIALIEDRITKNTNSQDCSLANNTCC